MACSKKPGHVPEWLNLRVEVRQGRAGLREGQFLEMTCVWKHLEPLHPSHSEVTSEGPWHWLRVLGEAEGRAGLAGQQVGIAGSAGKKLERGSRDDVLSWVPPGYSCHVLATQKPLPADARSPSHIPSLVRQSFWRLKNQRLVRRKHFWCET